ncbi:MAG: OFA family MFS transporter [Candidatus Desulfofervidaceae bacterium]|nr:OFA family MFS transporter [Candidatus Desulfofervidaceae bacterium]
MTEQKVMNRWLVVVGAILIQLCLGAIYAWSVFTPYLKDPNGPFKFTATQTQAIFSVGLAVFALVMIFAGRLQQNLGPRPVCMAGGVLLGLGYILAKFLGHSFMGQVFCIGVIGGAGIGLAYVVPIAVGMKWFPDKKGMITGLAVAGFGFGATIWVKWAGAWGHLIDKYGVLNVFMLYGIIFAVCVFLGSLVMVNPPAGWKPEGWTPPQAEGGKRVLGAMSFEPNEMLRTSQFYALWLTFIFSAMAGLMVIGCIKLFGIDSLQKIGMDKASASAAAGTAMACLAIFNGLGRIVWGTVSDKIGRKAAIAIMCTLQGIMMLVFYFMGNAVTTLIIGAIIIGFNFGGNFALFPTATADFFGLANVGPNYGWVFTAYGAAGIFGPILGGYVRDHYQTFLGAFIPAGIACLLGAVIMIMTKPPHKA